MFGRSVGRACVGRDQLLELEAGSHLPLTPMSAPLTSPVTDRAGSLGSLLVWTAAWANGEVLLLTGMYTNHRPATSSPHCATLVMWEKSSVMKSPFLRLSSLGTAETLDVGPTPIPRPTRSGTVAFFTMRTPLLS